MNANRMFIVLAAVAAMVAIALASDEKSAGDLQASETRVTGSYLPAAADVSQRRGYSSSSSSGSGKKHYKKKYGKKYKGHSSSSGKYGHSSGSRYPSKKHKHSSSSSSSGK